MGIQCVVKPFLIIFFFPVFDTSRRHDYDLRIPRKIVGAVILGNEIKIGNLGWVEGCEKGILSRIADGGGGKSRLKVGVI